VERGVLLFLARFVEALYSKWNKFQEPPRHPKWRETNLAAVAPGWKRFEAAEEWLRTHAQVSQADRGKFDQFPAAGDAQPAALPQGERDRLFQEFVRWNRARERQ